MKIRMEHPDGRHANVEPGSKTEQECLDAGFHVVETPQEPEPAPEATQPDPTGEGTPEPAPEEPSGGNTFVRPSGGRRRR